MKIRALAPWFGGNRTSGEAAGKALGRLSWCGVLFAGGMPELPHIDTAAGVAIDLHRHIINLAKVVASDELLLRMIRIVGRKLHHADEIAEAQCRCRDREIIADGAGLFGSGAGPIDGPDVQWAADYFTACWMGRGGIAGGSGEFSQGLSVRYTSSGGGSARRWRSAVESLPAWGEVLSRWSFATESAFAFLRRLGPQQGAGLYLDPPWVEEGDAYTHAFRREDHIRLAQALLARMDYRIVLRYGDHPLIRELYPSPEWRWITSTTTNQHGAEVREVLIVNGEPCAQ